MTSLTASQAASAPSAGSGRNCTRSVSPLCCPSCGSPFNGTANAVFKKGALTISYDPVEVRWFGSLIPLSPTEGYLLSRIAVRGKASFCELDEHLTAFGTSPGNRSIVILRIRRKFAAVGARDPFETLPSWGVRLRVDPDEFQSTATIIGLRG